jgi:hypothetical protein
MPRFKTTLNILKKSDENEAFESKWFDSDKLVLPPKIKWDYSRDLQVEDIDYWEVLYEASDGIGFYAAWCPYAEYYLITTGLDIKNGPQFTDTNLKTQHIPYWHKTFETFYGPNAEFHAVNRAKDFGILLNATTIWVDESEMWLHQPMSSDDKPIIIL